MQQLAPVYEESESRWLMRIILEHIKGWSQTDIMLNSDREAAPSSSPPLIQSSADCCATSRYNIYSGLPIGMALHSK